MNNIGSNNIGSNSIDYDIVFYFGKQLKGYAIVITLRGRLRQIG